MSGGYNLGTASGRIEIDGSGVDKGFAVARSAVGAFADSVNSQREQMEEYGKTMTRNALIGAGGFAIATKSAAGFEKQLSAIAAVSGATEDDMKRVATAALEIGANSAFSATEAANAFEELIKAGIPLEQALDGAAKATTDLAAAGGIALPRAAEIAANAMNNFKKSGKDMPKIADAIAGAANASAISVEEFAQSLSQVGAVANLAGLSFEDTAVAIAEMGNAGIKGSDAGTSLKTMLMNLIPTMDKQIAKFEEMGLMTFSADKAMTAMAKKGIPSVGNSLQDVRRAVSDYLEATQGIKDDTVEMGKAVDEWLMSNGAMQNAFFTTEGNVKSLAEIQQVLQDSTKGMTREQKLASLEVLFGADAIRGAAVMADNGADGYNKLAEAMGKVGAADTAEKRMDNLAGDIEALRGAVETLTIRLGDIFLPLIRQIVQGLTDVVNFFGKATDAGIEMMSKWLVFKTIGMGVTGVIIALIAQFGGLLTVMLAVTTAFRFADAAKASFAALRGGQGVVKALSLLFTETIRGSILFRSAFKALEIVFVRFLGFGGILTIFRGIGPALAAGVGPMAVAATTLRGLGAVLATVGGRIGTLLTGISKVGGAFSLMGGWVGLVIRILIGLVTLGRLLYGTWEPFRNLVDGIAAAIGGAFTTALNALNEAWNGLIAGFSGATAAGGEVSGVFAQIGAAIRPVIDWLVEIAQGVVANIVPAFQELMAVAGAAVGPALAELGNVIATTLWPALQELGKVIVDQVWPAIQELATALWPIIQVIGIVAGVVIGVLFVAWVKLIEFMLGVVIPAVLRIAGPVFAFLIGAIAKVISVIAMFITPIVWVATFIIGTLIPAILKFAAAMADSVVAAVTWVVEAIRNVIKWFQDIPGAVDNINREVNGFFTQMGQGILDVWNNVVGWITGVFDTIALVIRTYIDLWVTSFMALVNFWRPVWEPLVQIVSAIFDVIMAIVNGFVGLFVKLFQYVFGMVQFIIGAFITWVSGEWNKFWSGLTAIVDIAVGAVVGAWNNFTTLLSLGFGWLSSQVTAIWTTLWLALQAILQPYIDWFNNTIGAWWNSMFGQAESGSSGMTDIFDGFWSGARAIWDVGMKWISDILNTGLNMITGYINDRVNAWRGIFDMVWNWIKGIFQGAIDWLNSITNGGFSRMVEIIRSAVSLIPGVISSRWEEAMGFLRGIPGAIQSIFNGAVNWLGNVGGQIIEGLLSGLRAAAGNIESFFRGLTDMIPEWKGPYKRDKVLLEPAGQAIMQSLHHGFEDELKDFYRMLDDMNVDIPLALSATLNPSIPTLEGTLNGVPTNSTNIVQGEDGKINMTPKFDVKVRIGDRDITDIVDVRVEEHFDEAATLISTGVLD
jgi:phage-related protein